MYREYEERKSRLPENLTPEEYEKEIQKIAEELEEKEK